MQIDEIIETDCYEHEHHPEVTALVQEKMPSEEQMYKLAELYKLFGDSTRVRILCALSEKELCVCQIAMALKMTQSAISHQLKILKQGDLIKSHREGKSIIYSLADDHVRTIISQGIDHINE